MIRLYRILILNILTVIVFFQQVEAQEIVLQYEMELKNVEDYYGTNSEEYLDDLKYVSWDLRENEYYSKSLEYMYRAIDIVRKLHSEDSIEYVSCLTELSKIYSKMGRFDKAMPIQREALSFFSNKDTRWEYAEALQAMSLIFNGVNDYTKEIEYLNKVKQILILSGKKTGLNDINNNLAVAYENIGNYQKAFSLKKEVLSGTAQNDKDYSVRVQNLAYAYSSLGEYEKSLQLYFEALKLSESKFGTYSSRTAQILDCIGQLYYEIREFEKAEGFFRKAIEVLDNIMDINETHTEYGFYESNFANTLIALDRNAEAINMLDKSIKRSKKSSFLDQERYLMKQHNLARAHMANGNYKTALNILNQHRVEVTKLLDKNNYNYGQFLKTLGEAYLSSSEMEKGVEYLDSANQIVISQIEKIFKFRSENENKKFIEKITHEFEEYQSLLIDNPQIDKRFIDLNLNNQLLLKNLLLTRSKQIISSLLKSEDSTIIKEVNIYRALKSKLNRYYSESDNQNKLDSLKKAINEKEIKLTEYYSREVKRENQLKKDWRVIQENLNKEEIAIEFSSFNHTTLGTKENNILYVAYIFKKHWEFPKVIKLFYEKDLLKLVQNKAPNQLYVGRGSKARRVSSYNSDIYNLVWQPLEPFLDEISTIYYSPSGTLNQIAFSALLNNNGTRLIDSYNLVQLSTTSKVKKLKNNIDLENILLLGGVNYNFTKDNVDNENLQNVTAISTNVDVSFNKIGQNVETWSYLPGTLAEVEAIEKEINKTEISYSVLKGSSATEEKFKELGSNGPKIIHIATHGFFNESEDSDNKIYQKLENEIIYNYADDPLLRSGLILSGGNFAWQNGFNPYKKEDGILTSLEISNLDLQKTEIVVLSACETGLGDIEGSEGVYGLQRAFKMSGVNMIIMSLWEVPDKETAEFMSLFYKMWADNGNPRVSFFEAQRKMSHLYKDEPNKWAGFVFYE